MGLHHGVVDADGEWIAAELHLTPGAVALSVGSIRIGHWDDSQARLDLIEGICRIEAEGETLYFKPATPALLALDLARRTGTSQSPSVAQYPPPRRLVTEEEPALDPGGSWWSRQGRGAKAVLILASLVLVVAIGSLGGDRPESAPNRAATTTGSGAQPQADSVSSRSEMWLDRLEIALSESETETWRSHLRQSCDDAEVWHQTRADREYEKGNYDESSSYLEDWIIIAEICNQALFDGEWREAAGRLTAARP